MNDPTPTTSKPTIAVPSLALLLLVLGLLALSFTAIFIKLSVREMSAEATVFNRLWIATLIFTVWNWQTHRNDLAPVPAIPEVAATPEAAEAEAAAARRRRWQTIGLLVALAIVHLSGRFLWTWSLTVTTAANGTVLSNLPPLFTALGGWLLLGQRFDRRFLLGLAIAVGGSATLALDDWFAPNSTVVGPQAVLGDGAALLSSVFYAASFLLVEKLRQHLNTAAILVWRCALGLAIATPLVFAWSDPVFPSTQTGWLAVLGLAAISEVLGHGLIVYSLKHFSSTFVTLVLLLEPVLTATLAWQLFDEFLNPINLLGFVLILLGIYLATTGKGADKDPPPDSQDHTSSPAIDPTHLVEAAIEP